MLETRTMYHVEKFLPPECPRCRARFQQQNVDYVPLLGDLIDGKKVVRQTEGYTIIICQHCDNYTVRILLETYQLGDRDRAEALLEQGFANLQEERATGNMARDCHAFFCEMPALRILGLGPED
jgi:hypothetical protein